jgi:tRNA threonylcarbamoyladenosine biosynthesis protein TsaB
VPVGNLAATACDAFERDTRVQRVLVAQDARMNEAYWAVYERAGERVEEIAPPALAAPEQLAQLAAMHRADAIAGNGLQSFSAQLGAFEGTRIVLAAANARAIATLALDAVRRGRTIDAAAAVPLYVRDRVALTVGERRARAPSADL